MDDNVINIEEDRKKAKLIIYKIFTQLLELRKYLRKARFWGVFDILGGGIIVNSIKYSRLQSALEISRYINTQIFRLKIYDKSFIQIKKLKLDFNDSILKADLFSNNIGGFMINIEVQDKIKKELLYIEDKIKDVKKIVESNNFV